MATGATTIVIGSTQLNLAGGNDPKPGPLPKPSWMPSTIPSRNMPEAEDIYAILDAWAAATYPRILQAYTYKGGWEAWAQIELAMGIKSQYPNISVLRELQVYEGTRERADLVLQATGETTHIIELKTLSGYQFAQYGDYSFAAGFIDDIQKIAYKDLRDGYAPAALHAIGFCCIDDANIRAGSRIASTEYGPNTTGIPVAGANTIGQPYLFRWSYDVAVTAASVLDAKK